MVFLKLVDCWDRFLCPKVHGTESIGGERESLKKRTALTLAWLRPLLIDQSDSSTKQGCSRFTTMAMSAWIQGLHMREKDESSLETPLRPASATAAAAATNR